MSRTTFKSVKRSQPCGICRGTDRCSRGADGLISCHEQRGPVPGYVYLGQAKGNDEFALYRREDDPILEEKRRENQTIWHQRARGPSAEPPNGFHASGNGDGASVDPTPSIGWSERAATYARDLTPARRAELIEAIGLPDSCLDTLGPIGYIENGPHKDKDGNSLGPCWTFPERNAAGEIIGIMCRYRNGQKKAFPGGQRGLSIAAGCENRDGPLFLPEGVSDALTLVALNLAPIGRPSNTGGVEALVERLKNIPPARLIVVMAEYDPKKTGKWPGRDGAIKTAQELTAKLGRPVQWALPPDGSKDVRAWFLAQRPDLTCADGLQELGEKLRTIIEGQLQPAGDPEKPTSGYTFAVIDSATFFAADYRLTWLVKRLLVRGQPAIIGGPQKTLKTSLVIDLVVSLATGTPFLGCFQVYRPVRVALLSGESGEHTLQETGRRVCAARGTDPATLDALWDFRLPQLANGEHLAILQAGLVEHKVEVLVIDPIYLCLLAGGGISGPRAENVFDMGPLLLSIAQVCLKVGCTPVLIHHTKKWTSLKPLELPDLAYAGLAEFARQWLLISRRKEYEPGTGLHQLWLNVGGSAGQSGLWSVDVDEGVIDEHFAGRKWDVTVTTANETRQAAENEQQEAKSRKQQDKDKADDADLLMALDGLDPDRHGAGWNKVQAEARLSDSRMFRSVHRLVGEQIVQEITVQVEIGSKVKRTARGLVRSPKP